jgi:hypothetical protein
VCPLHSVRKEQAPGHNKGLARTSRSVREIISVRKKFKSGSTLELFLYSPESK